MRHRPTPVVEREARVQAAHGARLQRDVLRRSPRLATHNELRGLAGTADEAISPLTRFARHDFETPGENLHRLVGRATKADRFRSDIIAAAVILTRPSVRAGSRAVSRG